MVEFLQGCVYVGAAAAAAEDVTLEVFTSVVVYEQKQHQRLVTNTNDLVAGKELKMFNPLLLSTKLTFMVTSAGSGHMQTFFSLLQNISLLLLLLEEETKRKLMLTILTMG